MEEERIEGKTEGWQSISTVSGVSQPFLDKTLYWEGYDNSSNVYAIAGDSLTIIDPGNDYIALMELFRMGHKPQDVEKILLTHGHVEHVMGAFELFRYPVLEDKKLEIIVHGSGPVGFQETLKELLKEIPRSVTLTEVQGGETLNLGGFDVEVIHTPGHTMDSLCFYHAPSRALFTGDTVLPYVVASPDPSAGGRAEYHMFTLKRLMGMKIDVLLPGHGQPVLSEARKVLEGSYTGVIKKMVGLETPWLAGAATLAQKGYLEECLFCCEKERELHPENGKALELKATCLTDLGRFAEAIGVFEQVREMKENPMFALLGKGVALMGLEKYGESLTAFEEILRENPDSREALIYKGMALYFSGRYDEAMQVPHFEKEFMDRFKRTLVEKASPARS